MNLSKNNFLHLILGFVYCYQVEGLTCGNCVDKIKSSFSNRSEVSHTQVSLVDGTLKLHAKKELNLLEQKNLIGVLPQEYKAKQVPCVSQ